VKGSSIFFYGWVIVGISTLVFAIVRGVNDSFSTDFREAKLAHIPMPAVQGRRHRHHRLWKCRLRLIALPKR